MFAITAHILVRYLEIGRPAMAPKLHETGWVSFDQSPPQKSGR